MKNAGTILRPQQIEFFLRLHGLWEGITALPPPPEPPFDIETMEPLDAPPSAQWGWTDELDAPPAEWWTDSGAEPAWQAPELKLDDGRTLVLDAEDPLPADEWPVYAAG